MYILILILIIFNPLYSAQRDRPLTFINEPTVLSIDTNDTPPSIKARHVVSNVQSGEDLCEIALSTFMRRTDSDLAKYIKPHLKSVIEEVASSPESDDDDSPSPKRIIKKWVKSLDSVRNTPRPEMDEVILAAVQKAFEEKEALIEKKEKKIEGMFSKKSTALITTVVSVVVTLTSTLTSIYETKGNIQNCTK